MRGWPLFVLFVALLGGCTSGGPAEEDAPPATADGPAPASDPEMPASQAEPEQEDVRLGWSECDMGQAFATGPVGVEGTATTGTCRFEDLDLPVGLQSMRVFFNWSTPADNGALELVLRDADACASGGDCERARAGGAEHLVLDITDEVRGPAAWRSLYLAVAGDSVLPSWTVELVSYAWPDPATAPRPPAPTVPAQAWLGQVACDLGDAHATGPVGFEGTPTAGVCRFEDLAVPDGAVSARVWFNWTTEADLDGLGLVLRDEDECGGGGCELARADGDPVVLDITKEVRGEARWEDLSLTVDGTSLMPEWSLQIGFYATPVPG